MNLAAKITAAAAVLVVGGLLALAVPAVIAAGQAAAPYVETATEALAKPTATPTPEPTSEAASEWPTPPPGIAPEGPLDPTGRVLIPLTHGLSVAVLPGQCIPVLIENGKLVGALVDHGAREFANGVLTLNDDGVPKTYEVVSGDTMYGIADRFCMTAGHLGYVNKAVLPDGTDGNVLNPGMVLKFDPYPWA